MDVSKNSALTSLFCHWNPIKAIDVSKNTVLSGFLCYNTLISALDVSKNTVLVVLDCGSNSSLYRICVNQKQYDNPPSNFYKDITQTWVVNCTATVNESNNLKSISITHIYNLLGQEIGYSKTKELQGLYIFHYSDGSVKKIRSTTHP